MNILTLIGTSAIVPIGPKGSIRASSKFFPRSATETEIAASLRTLVTDPESNVEGR
jgi:hypothetical protein